MAMFLDRVGGLMLGDKMYGDTEVTKDEFAALKAVPALQRADELTKIRAQGAEAPAA